MKSNFYTAGMHAKSLQSCPTLCDPMEPGSPVHGILQATILEWAATSSSRGFSWPRDWTCISCGSCIAGGFFTAWSTREALKKATRPCEFLYHYAYIIMVSHPGLPLLSWASSCNIEDNVSLWLAHLISFFLRFSIFCDEKHNTNGEYRYTSFYWAS